ENEFTRDVPELTRQSETNSMFKIKNLVTKNNTGKPDNSKGKDKGKSKAGNPVNALHNELQTQKNNKIDIVKKKNIENFDRLKIEVHNINELRLDKEKLQRLADQYNRDKMNIIDITKTNIGEKEGK
ncbi:15811_t:CDS:2, partial [Gigaspora margarita]